MGSEEYSSTLEQRKLHATIYQSVDAWALDPCPYGPYPPIPSSFEFFLHLPGQRGYLQLVDGAGDVIHVDGVDDDGGRGKEEEEEEEGGVDYDEAHPPFEAADRQVFPWRNGPKRCP